MKFLALSAHANEQWSPALPIGESQRIPSPWPAIPPTRPPPYRCPETAYPPNGQCRLEISNGGMNRSAAESADFDGSLHRRTAWPAADSNRILRMWQPMSTPHSRLSLRFPGCFRRGGKGIADSLRAESQCWRRHGRVWPAIRCRSGSGPGV